ncbi:MAG: Nucleotidyl transferase [uncultured bacterium]|nr:MAG: Nucleotidyl transferase [uncultured bacterium]
MKDGSAFQLKVKYVDDGDKLLGTGGAIQAALPLLADDFFVIYGDAYLQCDYAAIQKAYEHSHRLGLMSIYKNNNQWDKSNVEYDGEKICRYSKTEITEAMSYIDYGLTVFSKKAFLPFANKPQFDLSDVHQYLVNQDELAAYEVQERFYEIGSIEGIHALEKHLI